MTGDTTSLGVYAVHTIGGLLAVIALVAVIAVIWHRFVERRVRAHYQRALDNGDEQIRRAIEESEDAYARRPQQHASVPRQLERNHR